MKESYFKTDENFQPLLALQFLASLSLPVSSYIQEVLDNSHKS